MPLSTIPTRPKKVAGNAASESTASQMNSIPKRISKIPRLGISNAKPKIDTGLSSARRNAKQVRTSEEAPEPSAKPTVTRATTSTPPTPTTWVPKRTGAGYASTFRTTNKPTGIPLLNRTIKKPAIKGPTKALREISPGVELLKSVSAQLKKSVEDINALLSSQIALGDCISRTPVVESVVKEEEPVGLEDVEAEEEEELKVIFKKEILQEIIAYCDDINVTPVEALDQVAQPNLIDLEYDFKKQFEPDNMDPGMDVEDSLLKDWEISEDVASVPKVVDDMQVTNELQEDMDSNPKLHVVFVDEDIPDNFQQRDPDHSSLLLLAYPPDVELDSAPTTIDETKSIEQAAYLHLKEELQEIRSDAKMTKSSTHTSVSRKDSKPSIYEFDGFMNMDSWVFSPEPIKHDFVVDAPISSVSSDPPTSQIEHETVVAPTSSASTDQGDIVEASLQDLSKSVVNIPTNPTILDNLDKIEAELTLKLQTALSLDMNHNVSEEHTPQEEKVNVETCTVKRESEHDIMIPQEIQFYNFNYHQHFVSEVPIRNFGDKPLAFKVNDFNPTSRYQIRPEYGIVPAFGQERFNIQILFQAGDKYDEILHTDVQVFLADASSFLGKADSNTSLKDYWLELMQNNVKVSRCEIKQIIMNDVFNYATLNPPRTGLNVDYLPLPPPTDENKNDAPLEIVESTVDEILNGRNLAEIMWKGTKTVQKEMQKVVDIRKQMGICINGVCIIASTILCMGLVQKNYCGFVDGNLDLEPEKIGYLASMWHFIFGY